jgi:uncharacterized membrane-anchored protein
MDHARPHPLRFELANELHARPFPTLGPPERVHHLAFLRGEGTASADRDHLTELCRRYGIAPPEAGANHFFADFGSFRLKWERHAEFVTCTFFRAGSAGEPFDDVDPGDLPADWMRTVPGELIIAARVAVLGPDQGAPSRDGLARWFVAESLCGSRIGNGAVEIWTDLRIHGDGASRTLIAGPGLDPRRVGRLVQRLLEVETYRTLALLGLPLARSIAPRIAEIDRALTEIGTGISRADDAETDHALLARLTRLAAEVEELVATTAYRFGASAAYEALVRARLEILNERAIEGQQTIREFLDRRLAPAMRTCLTSQGRLDALSQRLGRCANLLRTRVDIALERQNRDQLATMNRRAQLQLNLQETVEGLSVVAISYYVVGLVAYAVRPFDLPQSAAVAIAVPIALVLVWSIIRRIRRRHRPRDL